MSDNDSDGNVISLVNRRKITALEKNVKELGDVAKILKNSIQDLTKYNHYSSIRNRVGDLFILYQDIKIAKNKKLEILERLKNE